MPSNRNDEVLFRYLAVSVLAFLTPLSATTITITHVHGQVTNDTCDLTTMSGSAECSVRRDFADGHFEFAGAQASAFATFDEVEAHVQAGATLAVASADATSTFDMLVVVEGNGPPGILVGHYGFFVAHAFGDSFGSIVQGDGNVRFDLNFSEQVALTSHFAYGVPFELKMSVFAHASADNFNGNGGADSSLIPCLHQFCAGGIGFTDLNGNPLVVTPIPEPANLPLVAVMFAIGAARLLRFRARAPSAGRSSPASL